MGDNICVAVRVRPFNSREIKYKSKCCIKMDIERGECEIEAPPDHEHGKKNRKYTFDYVYWSHDESKAEIAKRLRLSNAEKGNYPCTNVDDDRSTNMDVYNDLGKKILENAWKGYNASIFAYGQTGSGKSYSMVGYGKDYGIIPLICNELFERVHSLQSESTKFKVQVSMMEIYNEKVQDLFAGKKGRPPGGLKVREHPKLGPYVEGLKVFPVKNYKEINDLMELGSKARTVAATKMNQTSSRAHTLFSITLTITEIDKAQGKAMDRVSKIVLVDLAGSERSKSTGATGDRLKEGCAINQSLSALGTCISKLVDRGKAPKRKKKGIFIPYRTSILTWLLRESLGGNSRTIMVAALSPASINYEETLSTLKYANRAKQIKNEAKVNEDPNVTIIKALRGELEELRKKLLETDTSEVEKLKEELRASKALIQSLEKTDENAREEMNEFTRDAEEDMSSMQVSLDSKRPCISNLHPDKQFSGNIIFVIGENEEKVVGKKKDAKIRLGGVSIKDDHVVLINRMDKLFIKPIDPEGITYLNGILLEEEKELHHFDRIIFGSRKTFRAHIPKEMDEMGIEKHNELEEEIDYLYAQEEFAEKQGLMMEDDKEEKEIQKAIKDELEKLNEKKKKEEELLEKQKKELEEKQRQMEEKMKELEESSEIEMNKEELEEKKRKFEEAKKQQQMEIERKALELQEKMRKLEEETKRQEELQKRIQEKEIRDKKRRRLLEKKLFDLIPIVYEANDFARELQRKRAFRTKLVNFVEEDDNGSQVFKTDIVIETENTATGKKSIWKYEKLESRFYQMQQIYQNYQFEKEKDENYNLQLDNEEDPFWDPDEERSVSLGICMIYLKCLSHLIDMQIWTPIINPKGEKRGELKCGIVPCLSNGELLLDDYISNPKQLIGKSLSFKVILESARIKESCRESYVTYKLHKGLGLSIEEKEIKTKIITRETRFPAFHFSKQYDIPNVTQGIVDYLRNSAIKFEFFAKVSDHIVEAKGKSLNDKMLMAVKKLSQGTAAEGNEENKEQKNKKLTANVFKKLKLSKFGGKS